MIMEKIFGKDPGAAFNVQTENGHSKMVEYL